ncbi:hypothetical protein FHX81_6142 [Saccharothrix saharensis]|uniref:Uncharacterized protein n=1 Tax=Saccharothrix saharensis TaxID=571190 RepID=A0A543JLN4_9PSEU|nr:hypothetical protein [Saccharothrix saharensis]TQM83715.1 hypothetical protein FHX81_6142 [Saccharothrix saharensis]
MSLTLVDDEDGEKTRVSLLDDPKVVGEMQEFVDDQAPRVFAVVQETFGPPEDLQIVAWGMTTKTGVEVISVHGGMRMGLQSAENALIFYRAGGSAIPRIFWVGGERGE